MAHKLPPQFEISIHKMHPTGEAVGKYEGEGKYHNRSIFVYGGMVGERLLVKPVKLGRRWAKAAIIEVLKPSPDRQDIRDSSYLSSSPWQMIPYDQQKQFKIDLTKQLFSEKSQTLPTESVELISTEPLWGYRNKMEFSFTDDYELALHLALHERFRHSAFVKIDQVAIAHPKINKVAQSLLEVLRQQDIALDQLKNLVIRYSYHQDNCIASLYVADPSFPKLEFVHPDLVGFHIVYSDPERTGTVETSVLHSIGDETLIESISGIELEYRHDGFFQVYPRAFEPIIDHIKSSIKSGGTLLDLYSGVGTIGLSLASDFDQVNCLEYQGPAIKLCKTNAERNKLDNITSEAGAVEKNDELKNYLHQSDVLIVDPPRAGLAPKVIDLINEFGPDQFIYVSCNPKTQALDFSKLTSYKAIDWKLFDLYPQTPHVESMIVMKRG